MSFTVSANTGLVKGFPLVKAVWLQNHCVIAFFLLFSRVFKNKFSYANIHAITWFLCIPDCASHVTQGQTPPVLFLPFLQKFSG